VDETSVRLPFVATLSTPHCEAEHELGKLLMLLNVA